MGAKMDSKTNSKIPLPIPMYNQHTCMDGHYIDDLKVKNVAQKWPFYLHVLDWYPRTFDRFLVEFLLHYIRLATI